MREEIHETRSPMPVSAEALFAWHTRPGALSRLQPPWERVEVLEHTGGIADGARVRLRARVGPVWSEWRVRHEGCVSGRQFCDVLESGPFAAWRHEHRFEPASADRSELLDIVRYRLPLGALGRAVAGRFTHGKLERLFAYRHAVTRADLELWDRWKESPRMKIAVTGATGMVGSALAPLLTTQGHEVVRIGRGGRGSDTDGRVVSWDPAKQRLDPSALEGCAAIINLAGSNVAEGRWTEARQREILESRIASTRLLVDTMRSMREPPRVFVSASAIGIYGDTAEREVDESGPVGGGFLAGVCREWETEAQRAEELGVRVVRLRIGIVLSPAGGVLGKLLPIFSRGLGGPAGSGRQWMSWISIDDLLGVIVHALSDERVRGAVNAVAPGPVRNEEFTAVLGTVLGRPARLRVPETILKIMFGQMAEETVLASGRVACAQLLESGCAFRHAKLERALRHVLGRRM